MSKEKSKEVRLKAVIYEVKPKSPEKVTVHLKEVKRKEK